MAPPARACRLADALPLIALASCAARPTPPTTPATPPGAATTPGAASTSAAAPGETPEQVITRLLSAEGTAPLAAQAVDLGGGLQVSAHGTGAATVSHENDQLSFSFPIGGTQPVSCVVFREAIDLANALRQALANARQENPDVAIHGLDAGFVGDVPYLDLQALYVVGPAEHRAVGHLKLRAFNAREHGFLCIHDEPGYGATFDRATRPLLEAPRENPAPLRYLVSVAGHSFGWMTVHTRTEGASTIETNFTSLLVPRGRQELIASDEATVDHANRAGELTEEHIVRVHDGADSTYTVRRVGAARRYHVEGRHDGHDLAGDFNTTATPLLSTSALFRRGFRTLTAPRAPAAFAVDGYASERPLVSTRQTFRLERSVDAGHAWLAEEQGEVRARMLVTPAGVADEITVGAGEDQIVFRRLTD